MFIKFPDEQKRGIRNLRLYILKYYFIEKSDKIRKLSIFSAFYFNTLDKI